MKEYCDSRDYISKDSLYFFKNKLKSHGGEGFIFIFFGSESIMSNKILPLFFHLIEVCEQ